MKTWLHLFCLECQDIFRPRFICFWAGLWLFVCNFWAFFVSKILDSGEASLRAPLQLMPWLLVPCTTWIAYHLWHAKARSGFEEWLQSAGLSGTKRLSAQLLAGSVATLCLILSSIPLALTIMAFGPVDRGVLLASFFGLWLLSIWQLSLAGLFIRISSSKSVALVTAFVAIIFFQVLGQSIFIDQLISLFPFLPGSVLLALSPIPHVDAIMQGVLDNYNIAYLMGGSLWLFSAQVLLQKKRRSISLRGAYLPPLSFWIAMDIWLLAGFCLVLLSQKPLVRFDWSEEKLYSISEGSRSLLQRLSEPVTISFYYSQSHPDLEPQLRRHGHRIRQILETLASSNPSQVILEIIDPKPDSAFEADARLNGLKGLNTAHGDIYLGTVFSSKNKSLRIPFFDQRKERTLEYELSEAIFKLGQKAKPTLGIITALPLVSERDDDGPKLRQDWAAIAALRSLYQIYRLPMDITQIPSSIQSLLVIHPKGISALTEYAIDQFILRGGRLVVAVDPFCETELSYNNLISNGNISSMSSNLPTLFKAWGIAFDSNKLVGDGARSGRQVALQKTINNPFLVSLSAIDLNREHPITRALQQITLPEPGWFAAKPTQGLNWEILAQSSEQSGVLSTEAASYMSPQQLTQQLKPDGNRRVLAGILQGQWSTAFPERPKDSPLSEHLSKSIEANSVVLIADVDFIADTYSVDKLQVMSQLLVRPRNDNVSLLSHAVDFLGGNQDLLSIRSSGSSQRSLSKLDAITESARTPWVETEEKLSKRIADIERRISELQAEEDTVSSILSKDQQSELSRLRELEMGLWTERRLIRQKSRHTPDMLKRAVVLLHLGLIPSGCLALGFYLRMRERRRRRQNLLQTTHIVTSVT